MNWIHIHRGRSSHAFLLDSFFAMIFYFQFDRAKVDHLRIAGTHQRVYEFMCEVPIVVMYTNMEANRIFAN